MFRISQSRGWFPNKPNELPYHQHVHDSEITVIQFSLHVVDNFAQLYVVHCNYNLDPRCEDAYNVRNEGKVSWYLT